MIFLNFLISFLSLILLLVILHYISDYNSWEFSSCEQLRQINHLGEGLKVRNQSRFLPREKLAYKKRFSKEWYHPIIEDKEYPQEHIFFHKHTNLFNKLDINIKLPLYKYTEKPILFKYQRRAQVILSKKDYKLISKDFNELYKFTQQPRKKLRDFTGINFIDLFFLSDYWSQTLPPCRGIKSCAIW